MPKFNTAFKNKLRHPKKTAIVGHSNSKDKNGKKPKLKFVIKKDNNKIIIMDEIYCLKSQSVILMERIGSVLIIGVDGGVLGCILRLI